MLIELYGGNRMKVLQINSVCGYGSTGRIVKDIYQILVEQGHECIVGYGRGKSPEEVTSVKIGSDFDNYVHLVKTRLLDKHGFSSEKATLEFIEQVKEFNPDIIHLHNIHGYYINIEILFNYLKQVNKPVIWTLHDCWAFTGHCAYFDFVDCDKWKTSCEHCPQKKAYPTSLIVDGSEWNFQRKKEIFTSLDKVTIITPSKWLAKLVKQSFLSKHNVLVINNGIDLNVFKPLESDFREKLDIKNQFIILGVASVWERRKGLEDFIELSRIIDNSKYSIILVGLSEKQIKQLPNDIIGISRTNNVKELAEIYSTADVFFNPTYEDNYPTTNLEALACGTPVITYNTGGSPESVDSFSGFVIDKGNFNFAYEIIKKIKENPPQITHLKDTFDKTNKIQEYIKIYEEAVL